MSVQAPRPDQPAAADLDAQRKRWMGVLARCDGTALAQRLVAFEPLPEFGYLRPPEPGSVMVRGRAGGTGVPFHLGEMTVTRCTVRLGDGPGVVDQLRPVYPVENVTYKGWNTLPEALGNIARWQEALRAYRFGAAE